MVETPNPSMVRSSVKCSHKGCKKTPSWYPVVLVWAKLNSKKKHTPMRCEVGMQFCHDHKDKFTLSDAPIVSESAKAVTDQMGLEEPDMSTAVIEMIPFISV